MGNYLKDCCWEKSNDKLALMKFVGDAPVQR